MRMKKIIFAVVLAIAALLYAPSSFILYTATPDASYSVYCDEPTTAEYTLDWKQACKTCLLEKEQGISLIAGKDFDRENFLRGLAASNVFSEYCEGIILEYYSSPFVRNYIELNGYKINIEIALRPDGTVIIGSPIILGSI